MAGSTRKAASNTTAKKPLKAAATRSRTGATRKSSASVATATKKRATRASTSSSASTTATATSSKSAKASATSRSSASSPASASPSAPQALASAQNPVFSALQAAQSPVAVTAAAEQAKRVLARRRLISFTQRLNDRYKAGWVHEDIARRLERFSRDVAEGKSPRLMLLMPPRHGKSELASRMFPAWHLGHQPDHEIIACSYNVSLAMAFSRKVKAVLEDPGYHSVFDTRLNPNNQSVEEWGLAKGRGGYVAAGVGGGITGKGAHILIIDDPIKNAEEADSPEVREKLWDWYGSTAYTRLAPGGGVLVIQTWWHDDDLAGRLQTAMRADPEADQFEVVKYPALAEDDEYLDLRTDMIVGSELLGELEPVQPTILQETGARPYARRLRRKGEALHPDRYDGVKLRRIKKTIQPRHWSALFQQNPVPDEGAYFTKDQFRTGAMPPKERCNVYIAWDFAISEKKQNDFTVGTVGLQDDDDVLNVPEVMRFKTQDSLFMVEAILNLARRWMHRSLVVGFEDGQIWRAISALLFKRMREEHMTFAIEVLQPIQDKMARARPLQGRMQQGMVIFDGDAGWYDTVKTEMLRFPAGVHDDCVDSLAWMASLAINRIPPRKPKQQSMTSWKDRLSVMSRGSVGHMAA